MRSASFPLPSSSFRLSSLLLLFLLLYLFLYLQVPSADSGLLAVAPFMNAIEVHRDHYPYYLTLFFYTFVYLTSADISMLVLRWCTILFP
jgi:hypothetical protein